MTAFFVPGTDPDTAESRYAELAELAGAAVGHPADRVRSVRFVRGAEEWTAAVGEHLSGRLAARTDRRTARGSAPTRRVSDPATVQAVFHTGHGYVLVIDTPPVGTVDDSVWDNPVTIAEHDARDVVLFDG
ncbi:hypothetical protein [Actinomycetospora termitidis]|uniref:Uncharacterized protein n=1 Tax=Actinomycetospora termitidis TaxID=3053470 RepID=A0ABT7MGI3_9PSEU|nr:hypothetical protein [Actinomycetospora sp. Odt1-22]MDL5159780.1 hypothetical protein [Actinomycetospora sp. Odt1-22]